MLANRLHGETPRPRPHARGRHRRPARARRLVPLPGRAEPAPRLGPRRLRQQHLRGQRHRRHPPQHRPPGRLVTTGGATDVMNRATIVRGIQLIVGITLVTVRLPRLPRRDPGQPGDARRRARPRPRGLAGAGRRPRASGGGLRRPPDVLPRPRPLQGAARPHGDRLRVRAHVLRGRHARTGGRRARAGGGAGARRHALRRRRHRRAPHRRVHHRFFLVSALVIFVLRATAASSSPGGPEVDLPPRPQRHRLRRRPRRALPLRGLPPAAQGRRPRARRALGCRRAASAPRARAHRRRPGPRRSSTSPGRLRDRLCAASRVPRGLPRLPPRGKRAYAVAPVLTFGFFCSRFAVAYFILLGLGIPTTPQCSSPSGRRSCRSSWSRRSSTSRSPDPTPARAASPSRLQARSWRRG